MNMVPVKDFEIFVSFGAGMKSKIYNTWQYARHRDRLRDSVMVYSQGERAKRRHVLLAFAIEVVQSTSD